MDRSLASPDAEESSGAVGAVLAALVTLTTVGLAQRRSSKGGAQCVL
jgi:hypothetical protein